MTDNNRYFPLLLGTQELLKAYWPVVEPLLATAPIMSEFSTEDILQAAMQGRMYIFVFAQGTADDPDVQLVLVLSPMPYPKLPAMAIVTVAGKDLKFFTHTFWEYLKGWCFMNGFRAIDAYVPERLENFMQRIGFTKETTHVRLRLNAE